METGPDPIEHIMFERMTSAWAEMWQMPRILWTQWCDVMIDAWMDLVPECLGRPDERP